MANELEDVAQEAQERGLDPAFVDGQRLGYVHPRWFDHILANNRRAAAQEAQEAQGELDDDELEESDDG